MLDKDLEEVSPSHFHNDSHYPIYIYHSFPAIQVMFNLHEMQAPDINPMLYPRPTCGTNTNFIILSVVPVPFVEG
jgi:hypothetical protein